MFTLTISQLPRQIFISHACHYAVQPIHISCTAEQLKISGMAKDNIAMTLAAASFPCWEQAKLNILANKYYKSFATPKRRQLATIAAIIINEDIPSGKIYRGPNREEKLAAAFLSYIESGELNFDGFCKFNLPGYAEYLRRCLLRAEEELTSKEEEQKYLQLLRNALSKGKGELNIFFSPGDICQIWQKDEEGLHQLEGGHIRGVEWLLLANLICLDPQKIIIRDSIYAAESLLAMLDTVFGDKIFYEESSGLLPKIEKIILDKCVSRC